MSPNRSWTIFAFVFIVLVGLLCLAQYVTQPMIGEGSWMPNPYVYSAVSPRGATSLVSPIRVVKEGYAYNNRTFAQPDDLARAVRADLDRLPSDRRNIELHAPRETAYKRIVVAVEALRRVGATTVEFRFSK